jgi:hypothetical protein
MKKHIFSPFIVQFVLSLFCYIIIPVIVIRIGMVEIKINNIGFIIVAIIVYGYYFSSHFIPGIHAVLDALLKNYITCKMTYMDSYITPNWFHTTSYYRSDNERKNIGTNYHIKILLAGQKGKSIYSTTFFHSMEKGKSYTVTYGKRSKIVQSVLSSQAEEMLQFDVD